MTRDMKAGSFKRVSHCVAITFLAVMVAGCGVKSSGPTKSLDWFGDLNRTQNSDAFQGDRVFGIVSITADPYIVRNSGGSSVSGMISALSSEKGYIESSEQVFAKSVSTIIDSLSKTNKYLMLPPDNIVTQSGYFTIPESSSSAYKAMLAARGYRKIGDEENLAEAAQMLGLDAALHVNVTYRYELDTTTVAGLVQWSKYYASVSVDVIAVDENGKVVWKDHEFEVSENPVEAKTQLGDAANFARLQPVLLQTLQASLNDIMAALDKG